MNYLEWLGYAASFIILISIVMNSIVKLRWINLLGSFIFVFYGLMINAMPVVFMNLGITVINIYYLVKIYNTKEYFQLLPLGGSSKYFEYFIDHYRDDFKKYFDRTDYSYTDQTIGFYILRDMVPAGIFLATKKNETTLTVDLDYAIPAYRDTKIGTFVYETNKDFFLSKGFDTLEACDQNDRHHFYLSKMGFIKTEDDLYYKKLIG